MGSCKPNQHQLYEVKHHKKTLNLVETFLSDFHY